MKLSAIATLLGATLMPGTPDREIDGIASPRQAGEREITFLASKEFRPAVESSACGAVIIRKGDTIPGKACLETNDPYLAYAKVAQLFEDTCPVWGRGRAPSVVVDPTAGIAWDVSIGPLSVIGANVFIGAGTIIGARCVIEAGVAIGGQCRIDAGVIIRTRCEIGSRVIIQAGAVIGSDGFGNAREKNAYIRIPCFGNVVIEDDVDIGACTTIDRGNFEATVIRRGAKLDNLIHVAHNVSIGADTAIAAQTGISGSTRIGDRVIIAGQVGLSGHLDIGDDAFICAKAGVSKDVSPGKKVTGYPARDFMTVRRSEVALSQLPDLMKEVKKLRRELDELKNRSVKARTVLNSPRETRTPDPPAARP